MGNHLEEYITVKMGSANLSVIYLEDSKFSGTGIVPEDFWVSGLVNIVSFR